MNDTHPAPDPAHASVLRAIHKLAAALDTVSPEQLAKWAGDNVKDYLALVNAANTLRALIQPPAAEKPPVDLPTLRQIEKSKNLIP